MAASYWPQSGHDHEGSFYLNTFQFFFTNLVQFLHESSGSVPCPNCKVIPLYVSIANFWHILGIFQGLTNNNHDNSDNNNYYYKSRDKKSTQLARNVIPNGFHPIMFIKPPHIETIISIVNELNINSESTVETLQVRKLYLTLQWIKTVDSL